MGASDHRQHAAQGIAFDPPAKLRHAREMFAQRAQLPDALRGPGRHLAFHHRRHLLWQVLGTQAPPGILFEFFDKERLGPVMLDVVIPPATTVALGRPQLRPAAGFVSGAGNNCKSVKGSVLGFDKSQSYSLRHRVDFQFHAQRASDFFQRVEREI